MSRLANKIRLWLALGKYTFTATKWKSIYEAIMVANIEDNGIEVLLSVSLCSVGAL